MLERKMIPTGTAPDSFQDSRPAVRKRTQVPRKFPNVFMKFAFALLIYVEIMKPNAQDPTQSHADCDYSIQLYLLPQNINTSYILEL